MGGFSREEIMILHDRGYKVGTLIGIHHVNNFIAALETLAKNGYDFVVVDEIAWTHSYEPFKPKNVKAAVSKFIEARKAAKAINPKILIGDVEPYYMFADTFLSVMKEIYEAGNMDAQCDFIGGEDYAGAVVLLRDPITLDKLHTLKSTYGIPVHQWVTTVDISNNYIGKIDMVVLTNLTGTWGEDFPNWYKEAKAAMDRGDWILCP